MENNGCGFAAKKTLFPLHSENHIAKWRTWPPGESTRFSKRPRAASGPKAFSREPFVRAKDA
jgi:hypothetical protein